MPTDDALPVNPTLAPHGDPAPETHTEQGPPPADFATRPESGVPLPSTEGLNAAQVTALIGTDPADQAPAAQATVDTNRALDTAEGNDPDLSQS